MERVSNAMYHEWKPKHGVMMTVVLLLILAALVAIVVWGSVNAYAQSATIKAEPAFDVRGLLTMLIPAIWASVGPLAIAAITKGVNGLGSYIPRPLQVILSTILGAVAGSLADGGVTAAVTAVSGAATQVYAATKPESLLTTPKAP